MTNTRSYGSPAAFRRTLTERIRAKAESSRWTLPQLQRQMAYDRFLERLYLYPKRLSLCPKLLSLFLEHLSLCLLLHPYLYHKHLCLL